MSTLQNRSVRTTGTSNLAGALGIASGLVLVNIALMYALQFTRVVELGRLVFSNFFLAIATFAVTVGGGYWLASKGLNGANVPLASAGVVLTQFGYGLFGATILSFAPPRYHLPAIGIAGAVTALLTAILTLVVYAVDHSFRRWSRYSSALFIGGIVIGAVGYFVARPLMLAAGVCFFLGFLAHLVHEIWAVKVNGYPGILINAIGIYVAVMGVFIHVLQLALRALSLSRG